MASQLMVRQEMDSFHAYLLRLEPVLEGPDVPVPVGIDAVDHDEPQIEAGAGVAEALHVLQYLPIALAHILSVAFGVKELHIVKEEVRIRQDRFKSRKGNSAAGVDALGNAFFSQGPDEPGDIALRLGQDFTARQGDAAARTFIEKLVLHGLADEFCYGIIGPDLILSPIATLHSLNLEALTLRIMAPWVGQGTAFEENRRPYPRPVVDGKFLHIENQRPFLSHIPASQSHTTIFF